MDQRLEKALEFSHYSQTLNNQIALEKTKIENHLLYAFNGGFFDIDYSLITFVDLMIRQGHTEIVLLDKNRVPVKINDLVSFSEKIVSLYFEATNRYHVEYTRLRKSRNVKSVIGD